MRSDDVSGDGRTGDEASAVPRLTRLLILSYGIGELGKAILIQAPNFLWLFFLTEIVGLGPGVAGLVILAPMLWDAVTDPLFAYLADRTDTRFGKYVPYLVVATPLCGVAFAVFFTDPGLEGAGAAWAALGAALLFRTLLTVVDVPHNALMARVTRDSRQRSVLAGSKMFFGALSTVAIAVAAQRIIAGDGAAAEGALFTQLAVFAAIFATLALWQNAVAFRRIDAGQPAWSAGYRAGPKQTLRTLSRNDALLVIMVAGAVGVMLLPAFAKSILYYARYVLGDEAWGPKALLAFTLPTALSVPVWGWLGTRAEKIALLKAAHGILLVSLLTFLFLPPMPDLLLVSVLTAGLATGGINVMTFALLPDVVEYGESRTGQRVEAPVFGLFSFSMKVGNGLGAGLLGLVLGAVGFVSGEAQTETAQRGIELTMTLLPALGSSLVLILLTRLRLSHADHAAFVERTSLAR